MKTYLAEFIGRHVGSIGVRHRIKTFTNGTNEEQARLNLYDRFEHISNLTLTETKDEPEEPKPEN